VRVNADEARVWNSQGASHVNWSLEHLREEWVLVAFDQLAWSQLHEETTHPEVQSQVPDEGHRLGLREDIRPVGVHEVVPDVLEDLKVVQTRAV